MSSEPQNPALPLARLALERGDYGQVIRLLASSPEPESLLLLATAHMGLGRSDEALSCCRRLRGCADAAIRAQARELQRVLEAPSLKRPREWSLTLPTLEAGDAAMGRQLGAISRRRRRRPEEPPPPAVGPTQAPWGFALVVTLLVVLALALGGCSRVSTSLSFSGSGRLQISHQLAGDGGAVGPWQQTLISQLRQQGWQQQRLGDHTVLRTAVLPSRQALEQLGRSITLAGSLSGVSLPSPQLELRSRNWLVGSDEQITLQIDLRALPPWTPVDYRMRLDGLAPRAVQQASPAIAKSNGEPASGILWTLQRGSTNQLVLQRWSWSPLGLGAAAVLALLLLSLALQALKRQLGFGLPQLPG